VPLNLEKNILLAAAYLTTKKDTPSQNLPLLQQLIIPTTKIDERMMV